MRWTPGEESPDIEDRRDEGGGGGDGGGGGFSFGPRHLGIGGFILVAVLSLLFRRNFFALLGGGTDTRQPVPVPGPAPRPAGGAAADDRMVKLVSFVLDDVQNTWTQALANTDHPYRHAKLVLFTDETRSGCGEAETATGPFYCPADQKVYIDLGFYRELQDRFGAPGEFAEAYVLAHEIGHHVQYLLGIDNQVRRLQASRPAQANALSVRLELQADCLAGVWGHSTAQRNLLEQGDVESGLRAAAAVGDDRLQRMASGTVHPESWTHGSSAQRVSWFKIGFESGDINRCNTFAAGSR
ncbi:MAG TPA: neutral zinc metallopeptidase [Thermoanaerobaculia bacterium]|nr:neutral zinc metallopeptidase [Thermoanaerobaculia bacterium]